MNASELSRQLLFYGYSEVTDCLNNSPLIRHIYKKFLVLLPENKITTPMVKLFNEIYYQCVHINFDATPGVDVEKRYLNESEHWLESRPAMQVVFCCVYAILKNKKLNFQEECFLSQLIPYIITCDFCVFAGELSQEIGWIELSSPAQFHTMTCPIAKIPKFEYIGARNRSQIDIIYSSIEKKYGLDSQYFEKREHTEAWAVVTGHYSHSIIEKLVGLYVKPDDQLELIDRIQKTLPCPAEKDIDVFLLELKDRIRRGDFNPEKTSKNQGIVKIFGTLNEKEETESIKIKCESLEAQIEDLKKSHEMELARKEAQHKAEIDKIKKERNAPAHEPVVKKEPEADEKPKELTLTLSEIAAFVKERFSKSGADEICTMLYTKSAEHGFLGEDTFKVIGEIVPAVLKRDTHQTNIDITSAAQVNNNPQKVINQASEDDENKSGKAQA